MKVCMLPKFKSNDIGGVAAHSKYLQKELRNLGVEFIDDIHAADLVHVQAVADCPKVDIYTNHGGFLPQDRVKRRMRFYDRGRKPIVLRSITDIVTQNVIIARRVISVARWVTEFYKDKYKVDPIIIPNGVDLAEFDEVPEGEFCEKFGVEPGFFFWAKCTIDQVRDPTDFVKMAREMPDQQFIMTLCPPGQIPPSNLRVIGVLDWHWMKRALKDCGCLVSVSLECFPLQMLEAWACSKPVLGYDEGGIGEGVTHLKTGYLVEKGDLDSLIVGAEYIIKHGKELGRTGRKEAERKYQWKDVAQQNLKVYEEVLEEKRRERPKVTVVIPCYNMKESVGRSVDSILAQTHKELELFVVDDGSVDGSSGVIKSKIKNDKRAMLIRQENRGVADALNRGLEAGDGKYCMNLNADDIIRPTFLQKAVEILEKDDRTEYVYSDMEVIAGHRRWIVKCGPSNLEILKKQNTHAYCHVFRRKFFERSGGYKDINPSFEDYEFNLHITKLGAKGHHIAEPLFVYTMGDEGRSGLAKNLGIYLKKVVEGYHPDLFDSALISVIIPCYNHAEFIEEAIKSVVAQTWPHWEIVIVDDGSKEPLEPTVEPWLKAYPGKIRLIRQENKGLAEARNTGIREARGEYIALLDADDKFMPTHLEKSLNALLQKKEIGYTYTDFRNFGTSGDSVVTMPEYDFNLLLRQCFHVSSLLFPKRIWEEAVAERGFGYDPKMRWGWEDWEWALWMGKRGHCGTRVPEPTYLYRQHQFSMRKSLLGSHRHEMRNQIQQNHAELFRGGELPVGCCGSRRAPARRNPAPNPGSNPGNPTGLDYIVTYVGVRTAKMTKVGRSGTIYRFSADPRYKQQFVAAQDIAMFQKDPEYRVEHRKEPEPPPSKEPEKPMKELEDDLSRIHGISNERAQDLRRLGVKSFHQLGLADPKELALSLKVKPSTIKRWQTQAMKVLSGSS